MRIFITFFMIVVLLLSLGLSMSESAQELQSEALSRALASFGLAKGLNMVISLIQGTELSFTPIGVGLTFSIGEILDPLNDMVERFSWVMLASTVSLGIQKIILELSGTLFIQVVLGFVVLSSLTLLWVKKWSNEFALQLGLKLFMLLLVLRFSALAFVYTTALVHTTVLQKEYLDSSKLVEKTRVELEEVHTTNKILAEKQKESGFFSGLSSKYDQVIDNLNISSKLESMQGSMDVASNNIIRLITIFIFETIIMPLLFLYLTVLSMKYIFSFKFTQERYKLLYN